MPDSPTIRTPPSTTLSTPSPTERSLTPLPELEFKSNMSKPKLKPIYIVVATSLHPSMGIGYKGNLPWPPIRSDMGFFMKVTRDSRPSSSSPVAGSMNAVIMGRKTWDSIPPKFRPLAGRVNVVISRSSPKTVAEKIRDEVIKDRGVEMALSPLGIEGRTGEGAVLLTQSSSSKSMSDSTSTDTKQKIPSIPPVMISNSLTAAISQLNTSSTTASSSPPQSLRSSPNLPQIGNIYSIGGGEIYRQTLSLSSSSTSLPSQDETAGNDEVEVRILQTQIRKLPSTTMVNAEREEKDEFEIDTFFPLSLSPTNQEWTQISPETLRSWIGDVPLPQNDEGEKQVDEWKKDEKAGVEIRVVGWEKVAA